MPATGELELTTAALAAAATTTDAAESLESDTPTIETAAFTRSKTRWQKCRDVYQGTEAVRAGRTTYLPQFYGETDTLYNARRTIAALFNGYKRTVLASVGLLVQPEPVLSEDMPPLLIEMWENVDGAGMHGAVFSRHLCTAGMVDGFAGIITEYPRADDPRIDRSKASLAATIALETGEELDAADVAAMGLRPYFILVKADEVLPVYETVNGRRTLVMLIRRVVTNERNGRFGLKSVTRYCVYELTKKGVTFERWAVNGAGGTATIDQKAIVLKNLTGIPWSPLAAGEKVSENEYMPTLMDLCDLNLTHHRIATGILSLEEQACVPTIVRVGCPPDTDGNYPRIMTGPGNSIEVPATVGVSNPVFFLSPPVDVLEPAIRSLENCKAEMGAMGASFLAPEPRAQETATAHRIDASAEHATIGNTSRAFQDCLESAFGFAGQFIRQPAGSVKVNQDFIGEGIDTVFLGVLMANYQSDRPVVTLEDVRYYLKNGELPEDFDPADKRILEELAANALAREDQTRIDAENAAAALREKNGGAL